MENVTFKNTLKSTTNEQFVKNDMVESTLDRFGMNWSVDKKPLRWLDGIDAYETDYFGVVRSDTKKTFGVFTKQYETFQNSELAELVLNIADVTGFPITHGKMFKEGARVVMQMELSPVKVGDDTVKRYATAINSHDGSTSLRWGTTGYTVSCDNQFSALRKDLNSSARHTSNMRKLVDSSLRALEKLEQADTSMYEQFTRMTDIKVDDSFAQKVIESISGTDLSLSPKLYQDRYSTRKQNITEALCQSVAKEMSYKGQTMWGLFSGITHYTTHKGGTGNSREESKLTGSLQRLDQTVFDKFTKVVKAKEQYHVNGVVTADSMLGKVFA